MLLLHPYMLGLYCSNCSLFNAHCLVEIYWTAYLFFVSFLIFLLLLPTIQRIKAHDIEIELSTAPPINPLVFPQDMPQINEKFNSNTSSVNKSKKYIWETG